MLPACQPSCRRLHTLPRVHAGVPIGELTSVICNIINTGESPMNVSGIMATLNSPIEFSRVLHNFTGYGVGELVEAGEEMTLEYRMAIPIIPEEMELQLAATLFYEDKAGRTYANTFFNKTLTFVQPPTKLGVRQVLPILLSAALAAFGVYFLRNVAFARPASKVVDISEFTEGQADAWASLASQSGKPAKATPAVGAKKRSKAAAA